MEDIPELGQLQPKPKQSLWQNASSELVASLSGGGLEKHRCLRLSNFLSFAFCSGVKSTGILWPRRSLANTIYFLFVHHQRCCSQSEQDQHRRGNQRSFKASAHSHRPGTLLFLENLKNILWVTSLFIARRFECIKPLNKSSHGTKAEYTMEDMAQLPGDIAGRAIFSYQAGVSPCGIVMRVDNITLMQFNTWP
ncbi:hypothetical protein F2P81_019042 [Scophthalmus maximus]|uniref:Uncharacterized protein n=1 Tax=Scophthalmus maximus TaxID=52904 RepID=A0A6A4S9T7_SCOMX|nr:hypothetical protein F2P81_019042 [Scophthalmus maximus]